MIGRKKHAKFIVFEGVDNCGKTTQAKRLAKTLRRYGYDVLTIREPGGTKVSERIRRILLSPKTKMCPRTELLLYLAARSQVTSEKIVRALAEGKIVIADRYHLSTYAYQIGGRGMPADVVTTADRFARHALLPDLTFILDITPAESSRRTVAAGKKPDRIEREKAAFFVRIRRYYLHASRSEKNTILLPGRGNPDTLATKIESITMQLLR